MFTFQFNFIINKIYIFEFSEIPLRNMANTMEYPCNS